MSTLRKLFTDHGALAAIISLIVLLLSNLYLGLTVFVVVILSAAFGLSVYVAFSKKDTEIIGGGRIYRYPNYRRPALAGIVLVPIITLALLLNQSTRSIVYIVLVGTATPTSTSTLTPTLSPTPSPTLTATHTPSPAPTPTATSSGLSLNVSVMADNASNNPNTKLSYRAVSMEPETKIEPAMGYLSKFNNGGPIQPIHYYSWGISPFTWDVPNLDIKIVNNTDETVFFNEAVFKITDSVLDPFPLLTISNLYLGNYAPRFVVRNEGWGEVFDSEVRFNIVPLEGNFLELVEDQKIYQPPLSHEVQIGSFTEEVDFLTEAVDVDISNALREEGIDLDKLASLDTWCFQNGPGKIIDTDGKELNLSSNETLIRGDDGSEIVLTSDELEDFSEEIAEKRLNYLGKFESGEALVFGELWFRGKTAKGFIEQKQVRFATTGRLFRDIFSRDCRILFLPEGAAGPPTYQYNAGLEIDRQDYEVRVPISQFLKPGEVDRFNIKVGVEKSSLHRFRLDLIYNDGQALSSLPIEMRAFVPRSDANRLKKTE